MHSKMPEPWPGGSVAIWDQSEEMPCRGVLLMLLAVGAGQLEGAKCQLPTCRDPRELQFP